MTSEEVKCLSMEAPILNAAPAPLRGFITWDAKAARRDRDSLNLL
jgi:hypothetical protein